MRKWLLKISFILSALCCHSAFALLSMELTRGVSAAIPIAISPFEVQGTPSSQDISAIIRNDLQNSGRFKVYNNNSGVDNLVTGKIQEIGSGRYKVSFELLDTASRKNAPNQAPLLSKQFDITDSQSRALAHHISDMIYQQLTGVRGIFSTKIAYIVVQRGTNGQGRYRLEISDQDGYNPRTMLDSSDPIMSPSWSPNGRQIAYVSFERKHAAIFIQEVSRGSRRLLTEFNGINGAPAWSPDGRKLAIVLSKDGSPNIYLLDIGSLQLRQLTRDFYINTEPAFSPDGKSMVFTSNRSGTPQLYQLNVASGAISRITYQGNYNARASFTPEGNHLVMLNRESNLFNIGILDLDSGAFRVLTNSGADSESPSMAPNGSMVLYGTLYAGRSVLGMVASDGSVQIRLPARDGEVQDPAWSPFIS